MKISEQIENIISVAEEKFSPTDHPNDTISVYVYYAEATDWQVGLMRPTQRQLDNGEIFLEDACTVKTSENHVSFFTVASSLAEALTVLLERVGDAIEWEDGHG